MASVKSDNQDEVQKEDSIKVGDLNEDVQSQKAVIDAKAQNEEMEVEEDQSVSEIDSEEFTQLFRKQKKYLPKNVKTSRKSKKIYKVSKTRKKKLVTNCPHTEAKHYAKGMCNYCYHTKGRKKLATNCEHKNKSDYARGLCHTCYNKWWFIQSDDYKFKL